MVQQSGTYVEGKDINPFHFLQHYNIYPRKPEEYINDNRVKNMYFYQVKIDVFALRPLLIVGNILTIFMSGLY